MPTNNSTTDARGREYIRAVQADFRNTRAQFFTVMAKYAVRVDDIVEAAFSYAQGCVDELSNPTGFSEVDRHFADQLSYTYTEILAVSRVFRERPSWLFDIVPTSEIDRLRDRVERLEGLLDTAARYFRDLAHVRRDPKPRRAVADGGRPAPHDDAF